MYESRYIHVVNASDDASQPSLRNVDLNLFRVFWAVYQAQNLTHAAAKLHLTQPAVSNALSRLRAELNDALFVRDGRRMVPTPLSRRIAPQVETALSAFDSALRADKPQFVPERSARTFVLGMRESPELAVLLGLADLLSEHAKRIAIHSVRFERPKLARLLRASTLDLAIDVRLPVPDDIRVQPLFRDGLCLAVRQRHPLRARLNDVSSWLSLRHVVVSARARGPLLEDAVLARLGIERDVAVRCQHYHAACQLVAQSDFALLMPQRYGQYFQQALDLALLPLPLPLPDLELALYWHASAERDEGLQWLIKQLVGLSQSRLERESRK